MDTCLTMSVVGAMLFVLDTPPQESRKVMKKFIIGYDGFITVTADNEELAFEKANKYLSSTNLINDGDEGEWYLISSEEAN